jgi:hypothetical protein
MAVSAPLALRLVDAADTVVCGVLDSLRDRRRVTS